MTRPNAIAQGFHGINGCGGTGGGGRARGGRINSHLELLVGVVLVSLHEVSSPEQATATDPSRGAHHGKQEEQGRQEQEKQEA